MAPEQTQMRPHGFLKTQERLVEAAGIETCAAAPKAHLLRIVTPTQPGVRLECKRSGDI
jgi:hypothetical protein